MTESHPVLVVATHNRDKGREMKALLASLPVRLEGLWDWPGAPEVEETGHTLAENALLKAEAAARFTGQWAVADDTGLEVAALGGAPGVYSARFAGPDATYAGNRAKLLDLLDGVPARERTAVFRTVIALARPGLPTLSVEGAVPGSITEEERGLGGFGYDAVFLYPPAARTFAEMSADEKNAVSHRGRALVALVRLLTELLHAPAAPRE